MNDHRTREHLNAERLQAFLEGALPSSERARAEEHLGGCRRCASELEAWRALFTELSELPELEPSVGFRARVLERVDARRPAPLLGRVLGRLKALVAPAGGDRHVPAGWLQDLVEGTLPTRQAERIEAHVVQCGTCSGELREWQAVFGRLGTLARLAPSEAFADRVMTALAARPAPAPARSAPAWSRALAAARGLLPRTQRAWAAISGVAVTPAAVAGLALYVLVSHPTLTLGSLLSFAWWKAAALGGALWQGLLAGSLESAQLLGLYSAFEALVGAPLALAGGALAYTVACALALRVLYKNLLDPRPAKAPGHA